MAHLWTGSDSRQLRTRRVSKQRILATDGLESRTLLTISAPLELEPPAVVVAVAAPEPAPPPPTNAMVDVVALSDAVTSTDSPHITESPVSPVADPTSAPVRPNSPPLPPPPSSPGRSMPTDRLESAVLPHDRPARDPAFGAARPNEWSQPLDPAAFRAYREQAELNRDPEQRDKPLRIRPSLRVNTPWIQPGQQRIGRSSERLIPIERLQPGEFRAMTPQERSVWLADQRDARNRPRLTGSPETDRAILAASQSGWSRHQPPKSQSDLEKFGKRVGEFFEDSWESLKSVFGA